MKLKKYLILLLALILILGSIIGCDSETKSPVSNDAVSGETAFGESKSNDISSITTKTTEADEPKNVEFPTNQNIIRVETLTDDELAFDSQQYTQQYLFNGDKEAAQLAWKIQPFITAGESALDDFEGICNADINKLWLTSIKITGSIITRQTVSDSDGNVYTIDYTSEYPEQTISKLYRSNSYIDRTWYASDVKENFIYLFGNANYDLLMPDGDTYENLSMIYKYDASADIFYIEGGITYTNGSPQILSYEKIENGYVCEFAVVPPYNILYVSDESIEITKENFTDYIEYLSQYKFTFVKNADNGRLILDSQRTTHMPTK